MVQPNDNSRPNSSSRRNLEENRPLVGPSTPKPRTQNYGEYNTHTHTHTHTYIYIYTRQKRTYCSFLSHRVLCMPVLNLPCGTRGRFQGVISSCNNISHLLSLLLPFFGAVSCCFSLPNCVVCWWQFGTVIRKVHSFLYLCFFVFFFPCCDQSVPGGLGYLMFPTVQNHRAVII